MTFRIRISSSVVLLLAASCGDSATPRTTGKDASTELAVPSDTARDVPDPTDVLAPTEVDVVPKDSAGDAVLIKDGLTSLEVAPSDAGCGCPTPTPSTIKVCGGDGRTHDSACLAACAGVTIVDGCPCGRPDGAVCGCNPSADLVCGSDGQTWTNACLASQMGVRVTSIGACGSGAQHGGLLEAADCDRDHDLCSAGLKCCPIGGGVDSGIAAPIRCARATTATIDQCPQSP